MTGQLPERVVYGIWREDCLAVLDDGWAREAANDIDKWRAVTRIREARALSQTESALWPPIDSEDLDGHDDEETFSLADCGCVNDGDWPGMPAQYSLDLLPDDWDLGTEVQTAFNGPYLRIDPSDEGELVRLLGDRGCSVRRDDDLINKIGLWPEGI